MDGVAAGCPASRYPAAMNGSARAPADLHPVAGGTAELPMLQGLAEVLAGMLPTGSKLVLHWRDTHGHSGMSAVSEDAEAGA